MDILRVQKNLKIGLSSLCIFRSNRQSMQTKAQPVTETTWTQTLKVLSNQASPISSNSKEAKMVAFVGKAKRIRNLWQTNKNFVKQPNKSSNYSNTII